MRKESGPKEEMRSGKGKRQREGDHSGEHFGAMSSPSFASFSFFLLSESEAERLHASISDSVLSK